MAKPASVFQSMTPFAAAVGVLFILQRATATRWYAFRLTLRAHPTHTAPLQAVKALLHARADILQVTPAHPVRTDSVRDFSFLPSHKRQKTHDGYSALHLAAWKVCASRAKRAARHATLRVMTVFALCSSAPEPRWSKCGAFVPRRVAALTHGCLRLQCRTIFCSSVCFTCRCASLARHRLHLHLTQRAALRTHDRMRRYCAACGLLLLQKQQHQSVGAAVGCWCAPWHLMLRACSLSLQALT
jgi:hypothetical protein